MASSLGRTPEMAKKQVCMIVLTRAPIPVIFGDLVSIDDIEANLFVDNLLLYAARDFIPNLIGTVGAIQEKCCTRNGIFQHVVLFQEHELVAGDEVGFIHKIDGPNRFGTETQMGNRYGTGFAGIIGEIALSMIGRIFADNLDGVLIGANGSIRSQAIEQASGYIVGYRKVGIIINGIVGNIVIQIPTLK